MSNKSQQIMWAGFAVAGTVGSLVMVIWPGLVTQEEAATLGTQVPLLVTSGIAVVSAIRAIVLRLRNGNKEQGQ